MPTVLRADASTACATSGFNLPWLMRTISCCALLALGPGDEPRFFAASPLLQPHGL
jgi:hypothetical protein